MLKSLKCIIKGHLFVDSRSQPGTQVCVRCRHRLPFEGLTPPPPPASGKGSSDRLATENR